MSPGIGEEKERVGDNYLLWLLRRVAEVFPPPEVVQEQLELVTAQYQEIIELSSLLRKELERYEEKDNTGG